MAWINQGNITGPVGPSGPAGPQGGMGPTGPRGATWRTGTTMPSRIAADIAGDMYLNLTTGEVYTFSGSTWSRIGGFSPAQVGRMALKNGITWTLGANNDWAAGTNQWELDTNIGTAIATTMTSSGSYFKVNVTGLYRVTFNINGGVHNGNLAVKLTRGAASVGGNTVFSWSGTSSESAVAASGIVRLTAGDSVYPMFWCNPGWVIVTNAFGQAKTAVTLELVAV